MASAVNTDKLSFIAWNDEVPEGISIGGKATNLFRLKKSGINVPEWIVIPENILTQQLQSSSEIKTAIHAFAFSEKFIDSICSALGNGDFYAVRSSASDEDGSQFSFAGQLESHLYVSKEKLQEKIKQVWLSTYSERVLSYRKNNGLNAEKGISVIIQKMVNSQVSGVAFGANPVTGNRKEKMISSVYGLGEGIVSGELNADTFTISNGKITYTLAEKTKQLVFDVQNGGATFSAVEKEKQNISSLTEAQLKEIAGILDELYKTTGKPQDIEFAYENGKLYLLQTRPITSLSHQADSGGHYTVWDNSNIIESYPGVTTPLTFSFIIKVYEAVYRQMCGIMGVSKDDIEKNENVLANMLGLIQGRVYYNLLSWYKLLALLPGYSLNAGFMEKMMGVKERFTLTDLPQRTKFGERMRVANMVRIMFGNLRRLPGMRKKFVADFNEVMNRYQKIDFELCRAEDLMHLYFDFEKTLLKKWKAPLVNDFYAMIYFGVLQKLISKYKIGENSNLHNDLLCGARDIVSTEPVRLSLELSTQILNNAEAKKYFLAHDEHEILKGLRSGRFPEIKNLFDNYLFRFGERCVGELKLETVTYNQNPAAFVRIIKSYVGQGVTAANNHSNIDVELREKAEAVVAEKLKWKPLKKIIFNHFLKRARSLVSNRENLRYERTRAFGVVRTIFCAIGKRFYSENLIEHPRDIFYLKKEEIFDFIQGTSVNTELKTLIAVRKKEFGAYEKEKPSERIATYGIVYNGNDFKKGTRIIELKGELKGLGCCPGRVTAKVRIVHDPNEVEDLNGDILVTSSTDPGWVTLFPTASAILVERGSLLSHSAIVSREMGKPCIVGVTGLMEILNTGDVIEMDGSTGEIKIISKA